MTKMHPFVYCAPAPRLSSSEAYTQETGTEETYTEERTAQREALPRRAARQTEMIRNTATANQERIAGQLRHILLVEDNAGDVLLIRQTLEGYPVQIHVARDGSDAIFMLAEGRFEPDLIVLDLNLPKVSGAMFLARTHPDAPVVVFSSSSNPAEIKHSLDLGAKEFVSKPNDLEEYSERVCGIVSDWLGLNPSPPPV
jgi:CheY-like chemotaxis protein